VQDIVEAELARLLPHLQAARGGVHAVLDATPWRAPFNGSPLTPIEGISGHGSIGELDVLELLDAIAQSLKAEARLRRLAASSGDVAAVSGAGAGAVGSSSQLVTHFCPVSALLQLTQHRNPPL